jgi:hypothetical protein
MKARDREIHERMKIKDRHEGVNEQSQHPREEEET